MALHGKEKVGVLLVNTGTPSAPEPKAVKRYLAQFLMDKRIAPMNRFIWWFILHLAILPKRSVASAEKYRQIWTPEGSPLLVTHTALAAALEARLESEGFDAPVRIAMSYGEPPVKKALREFRELECDRIVVLPLYPQTAHSTTLSVKDGVARAEGGHDGRGGVFGASELYSRARRLDRACRVRPAARRPPRILVPLHPACRYRRRGHLRAANGVYKLTCCR